MKNMTENFDEYHDDLEREYNERSGSKEIYESSIHAQRSALTAALEELIDDTVTDRRSLDKEFEMGVDRFFEFRMRNFFSACVMNALDHMLKNASVIPSLEVNDA